MRDEPDLYPPDIDVVTSEMKTSRMRAALGTGLVTFGSGLMLERMLGNGELKYFWMAVGFGLIAGWLQVPRFMWFAVGSILSGFAIGGFIQSLISAPFESTIGFLCAAAGFFAVYVRYPRGAKWAIIPAGIFAFLAVSSTGVELIGLIPGALGSMLLPLILIAGGALLVFRNVLPRGLVKFGIIFFAICFIGSAASTIPDWETSGFLNSRGHRVTAALPDIGDRTVVLDCGPGGLRIREGDDAEVSAEVNHGQRELTIEQTETKVIVSTAQPTRPSIMRNTSLVGCRATLPAGTNVEASVSVGAIRAEFGGGEASYKTSSGDIDVDVLRGSEGMLELDTAVGDIDIELEDLDVDPTLELETRVGEIEVDDDDRSSPYTFEGSELLSIGAATAVGDISVDR